MSEPYRERLELGAKQDEGDNVTVATFASTVENEMSREYLKAHGIEAFTHDAASYNPIMNVVAGGGRLVVAAKNEARARHLLERLARTPTTTAEDDAEEGDVRCPRCELTYCFHETSASHEAQTASFASPFLALLAAPFRLRKKRWCCHKCLYVWDDANEGPKRATPLDPDDPKPVFRLRRNRSGTGLFVGLLLMVGIWGGAAAAKLSGTPANLVFALGVFVAIAGQQVGRRVFTDVCSAPHCRAVLRAGEEECGSCHGFLAGVISFAHEHYFRAAEFRRELQQMKIDEKKALAKKSFVKKARALPAKSKSPKPKER